MLFVKIVHHRLVLGYLSTETVLNRHVFFYYTFSLVWVGAGVAYSI
jgi:hypothetical protein